LLVVRFRIGGSLRFLSHAQTLRVFQRACVRAGLKIQYSQGFNPRPRLSLPLPRPVGVASDDELLCLRVRKSASPQEHKSISAQVHKSINAQVPEGCELLSVNIAKANMSFQPCSAAYVLAVRKEHLNEELKAAIKRLLASESINLQRQIDKRKSRIENRESRIETASLFADSYWLLGSSGIHSPN
jgi:radical SAM-linked protein